ncbi:MAG: RagB/SusD family nutrient uptake outer membrane protein, partial [Mangrovibacterium sp.]
MKTKIIYFLICFTAVFSPACEEFIETEQRGQQNLDNYFTNESECEAFVNGIYSGFANIEEWWKQWLRLSNEMATDDAWMGNLTQGNGDSYPSAHYSITASNAPGRLKDFYQHKYYNIAACNLAIHRIADAPVADALKNRLIAEAKFFRAFNYWELVQNWGDVVLILEPTGTAGLNLARSPKADVYAQIVADLKDAEQALPVSYTGESIGRVTKGAAQALLARTFLFMKDYQNAYNYAGLVINSGTYQLEPEFINIWSVYNHNGVE